MDVLTNERNNAPGPDILPDEADIGEEMFDLEDAAETEEEAELYLKEDINDTADSFGKMDTVGIMIRDIASVPMLTLDGEVKYGKMLKGTDEERAIAINQLVEHNMRLAVSIAKRYYQPESYPLQDAIQDGILGLHKAATMFDIDKGFKFSTYATWWIKQSILRSRCYSEKLIRIPSHLVANSLRVKRAIANSDETLNEDEIAKITGLSTNDVKATMNLPECAMSLEASVSPGADAGDLILKDIIPDDSEKDIGETYVQNDARRLILEILETLPERECDILKLHYGFDGKPLSLDKIGAKYNLSKERIRQIEQKAIRRLKFGPQGIELKKVFPEKAQESQRKKMAEKER